MECQKVRQSFSNFTTVYLARQVRYLKNESSIRTVIFLLEPGKYRGGEQHYLGPFFNYVRVKVDGKTKSLFFLPWVGTGFWTTLTQGFAWFLNPK